MIYQTNYLYTSDYKDIWQQPILTLGPEGKQESS